MSSTLQRPLKTRQVNTNSNFNSKSWIFRSKDKIIKHKLWVCRKRTKDFLRPWSKTRKTGQTVLCRWLSIFSNTKVMQPLCSPPKFQSQRTSRTTYSLRLAITTRWWTMHMFIAKTRNWLACLREVSLRAKAWITKISGTGISTLSLDWPTSKSHPRQTVKKGQRTSKWAVSKKTRTPCIWWNSVCRSFRAGEGTEIGAKDAPRWARFQRCLAHRHKWIIRSGAVIQTRPVTQWTRVALTASSCPLRS